MNQSEKDYFEFVDERLGPLMCFFIFLVVRDWERAAFYSLSPDECEKLAEPASRIGPRLEKLFHLPGWVHLVVTTSDDTVTILYVMASYFQRVGILDKIMPVFSKVNKEVRDKYAGRNKQQSQPIVSPRPLQEEKSYSNGYSRQAIDQRDGYTVQGIGSQYIPD